ncbi:small multi-drug export protein [Garicola koreensis]|uniref:Putative membrane protein n=1 Tax=Garicola koreensis TaxID=1262554 RepID=A0A7W5TR37_9MICC|nr:small multi-drug export protein [Garicola koreensis]MBB3668250.1 putative membrane protein [Garicola koreensis]
MIETIGVFAETMTTMTSAQGGLSDPAELLYPEDTWIGQLRLWVDGLPATLQWLGLILISAIPFVESYGGGFIGVIAGMPVWAAIISAVLGNALSVAMLVYGAHWIRTQLLKRRRPKEASERQLKRREKAKRLFDKFGVPGVSLLGPMALPSQFTAPLMASFGANRHLIMLWMSVSIIVWGVGFVLLGIGFLNLIAGAA